MGSKSNLFGFSALLKLYKWKLLLDGCILPLIISILIVIPICLISKEPDIKLLEIIDNMILSIIPNLLGFVLSGYALLIGFGNITIIAKQKDKEITLYQKISTVFSISLLMQMLLLIFAFLVKYAIVANLTCENEFLISSVNIFTIIILMFGLLYVTFMIKDLVLIIFNYSQYQHYLINKKVSKTDDK
ncbi:MAG: hypothetical protein PHR83_18000 [Paludibacter sp.]|nr:hypothetical protein [Paludibacter sp.]